VAGWDAIDVWDLELVEPVMTLRLGGDVPVGMLALYFRSDATLVTISNGDPTRVLTWDVGRQQIVADAVLESPRVKHVNRAIVTSDGKFAIGAGSDETTVWRLDTLARVVSVPHGANGQALAVAVNGSLIATSGGSPESSIANQTVRAWSVPDLKQVQCWTLGDLGCRDIVCALAIAPDGRHLLLGGWEGVLRRIVVPT
jgi:WD40 repeat protein